MMMKVVMDGRNRALFLHISLGNQTPDLALRHLCGRFAEGTANSHILFGHLATFSIFLILVTFC